MYKIRDKNNSLACIGNPYTGHLIFQDSKQRFTAELPVGGVFTVERKGARTKIIRKDPQHFDIERE